MNWADWTIIGILAVSSLIGLKRGFVKEALSLVCWAAAFLVAMTFHQPLAALLADTIPTPSVRQMIAFGGLFTATLIVGAMVNYLIGELVRMTGLSGTDRLFGMIFGLARGGVVVLAILLLLPPLVPVDQDPWWRQSVVIPHFLTMEDWARQAGSLISDKFVSFF
ncbi:CvpA family protein [Aestuariicella hydrocarbonica]|uniref:CvpA family protein n=1 Tax=Pseudomaricurvus hydrocarbonicus TaxID=1470433 RepID=A0A9E5MG96_9GAMM|nr:CvpA family protein [Aestuariicella hydrocarbonica]NHO64386.1 CvpA family protein [Aestuariicella hydrocarbonica]